MSEDKIILTPRGQQVLKYMQDHFESVFIGKDLGENMQVKGIYSTLQHLIRRGLVQEEKPITRNFTNSKGETRPREYATYSLTMTGRSFSFEENEKKK